MNQLQTAIARIACISFITLSSFSSYSQSNYAVSFDGVDDHIVIPNVISSDFTIEYWMKTSSTGGAGSQWYSGNGIVDAEVGGVTNDFGTSLLSNKLAFGIGNPDVTIQSTSSVNTGNWVHVAATWKQSTGAMQLYINGVLEASGTGGTAARTAPTRITVGEIQTNIGRFNGSIDEVRIWNTVRTQAQIKANIFNKNLANNATGLVAYYRMNDGSGTTATNSCTNTSGIDGTLTNGPTWSASPIQFAANALHFDQVDDRVIAPLPTTANTNVTMELWVYHEGGTGTDHLLIVNGVMGTNGYAMYINTLHQLCVQYNGVNTWNTGTNISANTWTHLALVIGTTGFTVYKNGVNVYSNTGTPIAPSTNLVLGYNTVANGQPFDGKIDEVRIWNTARTQTEIQNNMNVEIDPATSGLGLYYTFDQGNPSGTNTGLTTVIDQTGNNNGTLTNFALNGATSNFLTQNSGMFVLPLKWISFTAQKQNEAVLLQWSTESEANTSDFKIEHSANGTKWETIGSILAKNGHAKNDYNYKDASPFNGTNYYRIRQNDYDRKYNYSKIAVVDFGKDAKAFKLISNPVVNKRLQFEINSSSSQVITLIAVDGKIFWRKEFTQGAHTIDLNSLSNGIYFLKGSNTIERLVIQ